MRFYTNSLNKIRRAGVKTASNFLDNFEIDGGNNALQLFNVSGQSYVFNQLVDGIDLETSSISGITFTNNGDGSFTLNGTATEDIDKNFEYTYRNVYSSHKYLLRGCANGGGTTTYALKMLRLDSLDTGNGVIANANSDGTSRLNIVVKSGATLNNLVFKPQLFDLTLMFGTGKEPTTVAKFELLFPNDYYSYDKGTIISSVVQSVKLKGQNLLNLNRVQGILNGNDFSKGNLQNFEEDKYYKGLSYSDYVNKNATIQLIELSDNLLVVSNDGAGYGFAFPIKAKGNTQYKIDFKLNGSQYSKDFYISFYDKNGKYISNSLDKNIFTTPSNAKWLVLIIKDYQNRGITTPELSFNDIYIREYNEENEYISYKFYGDEITNYDSGNGLGKSSVFGAKIKTPTLNAYVGEIKMDDFSTVSYNNIVNDRKDHNIAISSSGSFYVYINNFTSAQMYQNEFKGKVLYFKAPISKQIIKSVISFTLEWHDITNTVKLVGSDKFDLTNISFSRSSVIKKTYDEIKEISTNVSGAYFAINYNDNSIYIKCNNITKDNYNSEETYSLYSSSFGFIYLSVKEEVLYVPYSVQTYNFNNLELKNAHNAYDIMQCDDGTLTKKIGAVDLGTLDWEKKDVYQGGFSSQALKDVIKIPDNISSIANIICSKYITSQFYNLADKTIAIDGLGRVFIRDTTFTDATALKTALSGVILYYELNTPKEENKNKIKTVFYSNNQFTVEQNVQNVTTQINIAYGKTVLVPVNIKIGANNKIKEIVNNDNNGQPH